MKVRAKSKERSVQAACLRVQVINDSFNFQRAKVFEVEFADEFRDQSPANALLIRAFRTLSPQAEKFIDALLQFLVNQTDSRSAATPVSEPRAIARRIVHS